MNTKMVFIKGSKEVLPEILWYMEPWETNQRIRQDF